ncbi:adenine phosphoribosyltransferase [Lutibacter sp.]|uniref:adenine phosphoribosyltransferase n=1 Tax=Lutibacter sp. TaxID=1925666 RepID=UPI0027375B98|nr:adenine phosphoribosyltransferase [Lutibacter sp.]MDP3313201.1 adenine phosphoribosyltransferase [Lutibacter sp.]
MNEVEKYIRDIQDFPKEGVLFKDIATLLQNPTAMQLCKNQLINLIGDQKIDKVIGIESRGFFFGTLLAQHYNAGFIPVRKPGKLPFTTIAEFYDLEYGQDAVEIHIDSIKKGERVLIHDDVLATGGTAEAVCKLVERLGGEIVQCNFIIQLEFLNGKDKLGNYIVKSALKY